MAERTQDAKAQAGSHGKLNPALVIVVILAIVAIAAIGALVVFNHPPAANSPASSNPGSALGSSQSAYLGGGAGQSYISEGQAASLIGSGGNYSTTGANNATTLQQYLAANGTYATNYFKGNVTGLFLTSYVVNSTSGPVSLINIVLQSPKAGYLYNRTMMEALSNQSTNTTEFAKLNATLDGMTYSATTSPLGAALVGYKGNEMSITVILQKPANVTQLAGITAADMT